MHILITGGTGLIGTYLLPALVDEGHELHVLTRNPAKASPKTGVSYHAWDGKRIQLDADTPPIDAVINLAGAGIADKRWTKEYKREIVDSRISSTRACVKWINSQDKKPEVFISGSAVGYYGTKRRQAMDEDDDPGKDFLANTAQKWEKAAQGAGIRTVLTRMGIVMARDGGAFPKLLQPFKFYAGAYIGTGRQAFPWIHVADVVAGLKLALQDDSIEGPVNFVAPQHHTNKSFAKILGDLICVPVMMGVPELAVKTMLGERAMLLTEGQFVEPKKLQDAGFRFQFATAYDALLDLLTRAKEPIKGTPAAKC